MADDDAAGVVESTPKPRSAKKKVGKGKSGRRFKKMEKRRGTGIVVLNDDDDLNEPSPASTENAADGLSPVAEEGGDAAETGASSGRRRRHRKERGEKSEGSHSKRDAIIRGDKIEEEFEEFDTSKETFRLKLKLAEANNRISYLDAQLMLLRQDLKEHKERLDHVEEEKRALVKALAGNTRDSS